jgi:hypothetical protein
VPASAYLDPSITGPVLCSRTRRLFVSMPGGGAYRRQATGCARASQPSNRQEASCPKSFSMPPAARGRGPRCPASTLGARRATRASGTRPTPPTVAEIVAVMPHAGTGLHARACARSSLCCGGPGCASTKRSRSARPISIRAAARCSCAAGSVVAGAKSAWTTGPGNSSSPGSTRASTSRSARCCAARPARPADERGQPAPHAPELRHAAARAGVRRRFAPHQLRHAHAVEMAREGVPLIVIQRQLGHTNLGITSIASTAPRSSTPSTPAARR